MTIIVKFHLQSEAEREEPGAKQVSLPPLKKKAI